MAEDMKLLWRSPNKKWEIYDDSKNTSPYVASVYVTDGWYNHYAAIDKNGRITTGLYDTYWEYTAPVPKTIEDKAFALLRKMYIEKYRAPQGKKVMPITYFVKSSSTKYHWSGQSYRVFKGETPEKFFRSYDSAKKYAKELWHSLSPAEKEHIIVSIFRLSDPVDNVKDLPKQYGINHAGEIRKGDVPKWAR